MSYAVYAIGFIVLIFGLAWAATLAGVPDTWVWAGAVILAGVAILSIASRMNEKEPPRPPRDPNRDRDDGPTIVLRERDGDRVPPRDPGPPPPPPTGG